jgi:hypothetical protein
VANSIHFRAALLTAATWDAKYVPKKVLQSATKSFGLTRAAKWPPDLRRVGKEVRRGRENKGRRRRTDGNSSRSSDQLFRPKMKGTRRTRCCGWRRQDPPHRLVDGRTALTPQSAAARTGLDLLGWSGRRRRCTRLERGSIGRGRCRSCR